ncbi:MAG TPA: 16S rRNA (adenine(1518)-N(6)/adenine(1519)-N(6))-dimethyltransferase RsmA [Methylococcus sp.]|nr:16S rRNA (adenine(1518)-N(6)/adenine(1519)-N(6))-dimethyltransferase RsmA [Methylococcus sp.]
MKHIPKKRFGQNFLRDRRVIQDIVAAIRPKASDRILEIGPGEGVLTEGLLQSGAWLEVIELDRDLVAFLQSRFAGVERLRIHQGDALRLDIRTLAGDGRLRVVGNLPYNISTPLLFHLFANLECIEDLHFMLQKEVVDRLCAGPGDSAYGRLSVMRALYCEAERLFDVAPESFHPRPKVWSAVVRLIPHPEPPDPVQAERVGRVVAAAFGQRRKTLRNALRTCLDEAAIRACGIDPGARAETLSLHEFIRLSGVLPTPGRPSL